MMHHKVAFIMMSSILLLNACRKSIQENASDMMSKHVKIDYSLMDTIQNIRKIKDDRYVFNDSCYHLVTYYDSIECMSCMAGKMHSWDGLINIIDSAKLNVNLVFVFSPRMSEMENVKGALIIQKLKFPVYVDKDHRFRADNPFIPDEQICHTFLINSKNEIVLIGDPRRSKKLLKMFKNIVK